MKCRCVLSTPDVSDSHRVSLAHFSGVSCLLLSSQLQLTKANADEITYELVLELCSRERAQSRDDF